MDSCELCSKSELKIIWQGKYFYAIDAGDEDFPVFVRIVANDHVAEMSDLTREVRAHLFELLEASEEAIRTELHPDKMNWAQFGNMVPHLHWHLIARWRDDGWFPESPWGKRQRHCSPVSSSRRRKQFLSFVPKLAQKLSEVPQP